MHALLGCQREELRRLELWGLTIDDLNSLNFVVDAARLRMPLWCAGDCQMSEQAELQLSGPLLLLQCRFLTIIPAFDTHRRTVIALGCRE